jgi:hypothetical protein
MPSVVLIIALHFIALCRSMVCCVVLYCVVGRSCVGGVIRGDAYPCHTETQVFKGTFVRSEADGSVSANVEIKRSLFKVDVTGKCVFPKPQALDPKLGRDVSRCFTEVRIPSLNPKH